MRICQAILILLVLPPALSCMMRTGHSPALTWGCGLPGPMGGCDYAQRLERHAPRDAQAPNQDALCFRDELAEWGVRYHCKVVTSTRDSFQDMFDDDDSLAYEPASTAAVILTGGDAEAEAAALAVGFGNRPGLPLSPSAALPPVHSWSPVAPGGCPGCGRRAACTNCHGRGRLPAARTSLPKSQSIVWMWLGRE